MALVAIWTSAVFLGLIIVIPFIQPAHSLPLPSFYSEWVAFALGTASAFVLLLHRFWITCKAPKIAAHLFVFVVVLVAQAIFSEHAYSAQWLLPAIYICWAAILTIVVRWIAEQIGLDQTLTLIAWFFVAGGGLQATVGIAQYFESPGLFASWIDIKQGSNIDGNIAQRNHFATQISLASVALIYLFSIGRLSAGLSIALLGCFAFAVALSGSRAVLLYTLLITFFSTIAYRKQADTVHFRFLWMSSLLLFFFLFMQLLLPILTRWFTDILIELGFMTSDLRLLTAFERNQTEGILLRTSEWQKSWQMFIQAPFFGVGIGNYGWHSFLLQGTPTFASVAKPELFHHSHNIFFQVLAEFGLVGIFILLWLLWSWLRQFIRRWLTTAYWFIGSCLAILLVHSNLEYPLWYSYFLGIGALLLGLGDERSIKLTFTPRLGQFAASVSLLLCVAILGVTYNGYGKLANINTLIIRTTPEDAATTLQMIAANRLLTPWAEAQMATFGAMNKDLIDKQLELTTRVMLHHPNWIKVGRQIEYLAVAGYPARATALLSQAALAYPDHITKYLCHWQTNQEERLQRLAKGFLANNPLNRLECGQSFETNPRETAESGIHLSFHRG